TRSSIRSASPFEPLIVQRCQNLHETLAKLEEELDRRLSPLATNESLMALDQHQLLGLWQGVAEVFADRRNAIGSLDEDLLALESDRVTEIRRVFHSYSEVLERVSHLAPAELHRIVDDEAVQMNQTLLGNQRSFADLNARLVMSELDRERRMRAHWQDKITEWRAGHVEVAVAGFHQFVQSPQVQSPPSLESILSNMRAEQSEINSRRLELIEELSSLAPPNACKSGVAAWHQKMQQVCKMLDETNQKYLQQVYEDYERVCQHCLEAMDQLKQGLVSDGVSTEQEADAMRAAARVFEERLEAMDRLFEANAKRIGVQLKSLYKLAQGAAHLWDRHQLDLAGLERTLVERLDANREQHNRQNQDREAQLDVVMDKLRQESTEAGLKHQLSRALDTLKAIEGTYRKFKDEQLVEVRTYPKLVEEEVENLERAVCEYFGLERADKKKVEKKKVKANLKPAELAKIKAAQEARLSEEDEWIRTAFREILFTSRGSEFRVLTEAGVHGIPPPDAESLQQPPAATNQQSANQQESQAKHGYITLLPADATDKAAEEDENVRSAAVPRRTILEAKIAIRQNFLDFLDSWRPEAAQRGAGIVRAKTEELEAELRLRLHLHEPRARRAELDVHNVRAAELVMHSERVTRHTKGVQQTLDAMKAEFAAMNEEHERLMREFATKIDGMTEAYTSATKLVTLSSQCTTEVETLMEGIRTSLRKFRQGLDNKLQMLREANARFVKSFKLFSEGGNFCPEEVDDYRKRLDKMTSRVDAAESSILSELEGMEKKRLDAANAKVREFEEQFRNHMVDLVFMEKVARWLTNTQVKIKAEVSDSNSQSLKLVETLDSLAKRVDACARPNLDKETVRPEDLYGGLHDIFDMFNDRSVYLNCIGTQKPPPVVVTVDEAAAAAPAAGSSSSPDAAGTGGTATSRQQQLVRLPSTQPTPVSRPGKQPPEEPSAGVIKRIMRTQRARAHGGGEVVIEADRDEAGGAGGGAGGLAGAKDRKLAARKKKPGDAEPQQEQQASQAAGTGDNTHTPSLQGPGHASVTKMASRRESGEPQQQQQPTGGGGGGAHPPVNRRTSASRKFVAKNQRLDKKYMVFGEGEDPAEAQHFLGRVRRICREALDGMLLAAELYYRQKGSRPVTRPQALHETFDQCSEVIISKLQAYFGQADAYHNSCVIELRNQLERLERLAEQIPRLAFEDLYKRCVQSVRAGLDRLSAEAASALTELEQRRRKHEETLSPALGHPERLHRLEAVCRAEQQRHEELLAALAALKTDKQELVVREADSFASQVSQLSELLFIKLDSLLTADEVERGRVPPDLLPTADLLRKQMAGEPLHDPNKDQLIPRGKANWSGLPLNEFQPPEQQPPKTLRCATLTVTAKTTMAHNETDKARREFYAAFKEFFYEEIRRAAAEADTLEARWFDNWQKSVQRIRELY
uniref:DUF4455 domain-containing protein n=1 Tax=Macrostomum lignano TaxID=282301 RepID=A0A1I8I5B4_9PLAT